MKKTLTLLLISGCSVSGLYAQAPPPSPKALLELVRKHMAAVGPVYAPEPVHKGTAAGERLSAEADYNDDGAGTITLIDSARFKYSSGHHSRFDYNQFQYMSFNGLDAGTAPDFLYMEPKPNNYDSSNVSLVAFDSLYHYAVDSNTGNLYLRHREGSALFNSDTAFTQLYNDMLNPSGTLQSSFGERIQYTAAGRIARVTATGPGGSTSIVAVRSVTYNGAGNVIVDSFLVDNGAGLQLSTLTYYTYDAAGRYLTKLVLYNSGLGGFDTSARTTNTYYASGQLRTAFYEDIYSTGSLAPDYKDSLAYTPGVLGYTGFREEYYDPTGAVLFNFAMRTQHVTAGKKDSVIFALGFSGGPLQDFFSLALHLNASGNPVSGAEYDLQSGSPGVIVAYRNWYYEPINASGVGVKPVSIASISIAPNPTTGIITFHYPDAKAGTPVTVRVTNMTGQLVHAESFLLQNTQQQMLLGSEAVSGQYLISVQDAGGNVLCSRKIIKE